MLNRGKLTNEFIVNHVVLETKRPAKKHIYLLKVQYEK